MVAFVDDLLVIGREERIYEKLKRLLRQKFILKYLGNASESIRIYNVYDNQRGKFRLCQ